MKVFVLVLSSLSVLLLAGCGDDSAGVGGSAGTANCDAFCSKAVACEAYASTQECLNWCRAALENAQRVSANCVNAFSAVNTCVAGLTCEQVNAWSNETPPDSYPCKAQDDGIDTACF